MSNDSYSEQGFVLKRGLVRPTDIDELESRVLGLLGSWTNASIGSVRSPEFAALLVRDRDLERRLYDDVRNYDWLRQFSLAAPVTAAVAEVLDGSVGLLEKIVLRIDLPLVTRELAVWHQDHFYVKGNARIVTAWIPLQDTSYKEGCLMVMPQSHKLGPLLHTGAVLGKRHFPPGIFDRPVRYVEMQRGDALLFHAFTLHSSGVNLSARARLSVQARYTLLGEPTDPGMGAVIPT